MVKRGYDLDKIVACASGTRKRIIRQAFWSNVVEPSENSSFTMRLILAVCRSLTAPKNCTTAPDLQPCGVDRSASLFGNNALSESQSFLREMRALDLPGAKNQVSR